MGTGSTNRDRKRLPDPRPSEGEPPIHRGSRSLVTLGELAQLRGQERAKRALEIAAAGGHPLFLAGPAAVGKSLLARCAAGILPGSIEEHVLCSGRATPSRLRAALAARDAVLVLEELARFRPAALAALADAAARRDPSLLLLATMRSCPCGRHRWQPEGCLCPTTAIRRHNARAGAVESAFHLRVDMLPTALVDLRRGPAEPSVDVAARVAAARARQERRGGLNSVAQPPALERHFSDPPEASRLLERAAEVLRLPLDITLRVAQTIADLAGSERVGVGHLAEAVACCARGSIHLGHGAASSADPVYSRVVQREAARSTPGSTGGPDDDQLSDQVVPGDCRRGCSCGLR